MMSQLSPARAHLAGGRELGIRIEAGRLQSAGHQDGRKVHLRSRNNKDFNARYPAVARAPAPLPDETAIDGEVVALDECGRPSFSIVQNHGSANVPMIYYVFDVLVLGGRKEFVIAGYTPSAKSFDALIVGYYEGDQLVYVARTRSGFTTALREHPFKRFLALETAKCTFANLPEARSGRWGEGLTAGKMEGRRWPKPVLVGQVEFVEWAPDGHLRHSKFVALREDSEAGDVRREA